MSELNGVHRSARKGEIEMDGFGPRVERRLMHKERRGGKGRRKEENFVLAPWVLLQDRIASSLAL